MISQRARSLYFCWGQTQMCYHISTRLTIKIPIKIKTDGGFIILFNQLPIGDFGHDVILCSQPIVINLHLIKNVKSSVNRFDAVNKYYADRIKYETVIGNIPNTVMTDHTLFTFPGAKAFASGKIIIYEM